MARRRCQVAIVGAGSAGLAAHALASRHSDDVLLIDGGPLGTTCARVGCMPSKLLIAAADALHAVEQADTFGIRVAGVDSDRQAVMARVRTLRDRFVAGVETLIARIPEQRFLAGHARFVAPQRLQVGDIDIEAERIVLATGSKPFVPPEFAGLGARLLTSDTLFEQSDLPDSLAVIGGGAIGLELGQALHRLGVELRLFERGDRLGPRGDADLQSVATALLAQALPCELGVTPAVSEVGDGVELRWSRGGREQRQRFDAVLVAAGRRPNLAGLALEHSGLALDARGVPLFDRQTLRCGDSAVYVAGDMDGERPLLHEAAWEGRVAGENAARHPDLRAHVRLPRLEIAFTDPQYARIGLAPDDPDAAGCAIGEARFDDQGRSKVLARNAGMVRLYGDRASGRLLGAQLVGPEVEHLAHLLAWAIGLDLDVERMLRLPFYHPVIEEILRTALVDLRAALRRGPGLHRNCLECGPGG